eukprot:scaffold3736_cov176-Amphora_coffeaeformis.AAC.1
MRDLVRRQNNDTGYYEVWTEMYVLRSVQNRYIKVSYNTLVAVGCSHPLDYSTHSILRLSRTSGCWGLRKPSSAVLIPLRHYHSF